MLGNSLPSSSRYRNEEKEAIYFPHHERFNFDEDALKFGAALFAQFALDFSEENDMHIQHIALMVRDIEKSIKFYETITELKVDRRMRAGQGEISFLTNGKGETEIELICMPQGQKFEGQGMFICFKTDKLDEMHQLATEKSLSPSPIQVPGDGTRYFYVYDPDGVSVQLRVFGE